MIQTEILSIIITAISVAAAIYFGSKNVERCNTSTYAEEKMQTAVIESNLKDISADIGGIKTDIAQLNSSFQKATLSTQELNIKVAQIDKRLTDTETEVKRLSSKVTGFLAINKKRR